MFKLFAIAIRDGFIGGWKALSLKVIKFEERIES